ncbi:MAG: aspartate aminotransferase family protein [Oscillospiraceae bacterium]|jgi:acetylornithine/N-succinyldiaminopimelate aminotransferase|nr:aspartate aminotransferase family protein [Oscillospiraceae bacterium]
MKFEALKELDSGYIAGTYSRYALGVSKAEGHRLFDCGGRELIDFSSGIGVASVGYGNPIWAEAVKSQIDRLAHISNYYYTEPMARLAEGLCRRTGMKKVFFGNSGAEANEGAIKTARKYMSDNYPGRRDTILTLTGSFHGRTIATLAATGQDSLHKNFGPFPEGFVYAEANNIKDLREKLTSRVGAIMLECIQGEGGVIPLTKEFADEIAAICRENDVLLLADEIQTGMGRTGKFLCLEHYGLSPDVVTLAKGLAGGLPIGAVLFGEKTEKVLGAGDHGSTFGGNPVCCAGGCAVLEILSEGFLAEVAQKGEYLKEKLLALPGITGVSGRGMMLGAELKDGLVNTEIVAACLKKGVVVITAKHKLRFLPPLTMTTEEMDEGLAVLKSCLE